MEFKKLLQIAQSEFRPLKQKTTHTTFITIE